MLEHPGFVDHHLYSAESFLIVKNIQILSQEPFQLTHCPVCETLPPNALPGSHHAKVCQGSGVRIIYPYLGFGSKVGVAIGQPEFMQAEHSFQQGPLVELIAPANKLPARVNPFKPITPVESVKLASHCFSINVLGLYCAESLYAQNVPLMM